MPDGGEGVYNVDMVPSAALRRSDVDIAEQLYIRLQTFDVAAIDARWRSRDNRDSFWRLYVNNRDGAAVCADGRWHELTAGRVHVVPAWVRFDCRCTASLSNLYIHFTPIGVPGTVTRELFAGPIALPEDAASAALAERLRAALRSDQFGGLEASCAAKALTFATMTRLIGDLPEAAQRRLAPLIRSDSVIAPALRLIDAEFGRPLRIDEMASACHLSADHFIRRFREAVGQTPGQYLAERRVAAAAEMLLLSDLSIERIAERCGFSNRFYFTRVFARLIGTPPATYRRAEVV